MEIKNQEELSVAQRVKKVRVEKNFSQDYLAKKLGLSQKAYSKIENSESKLNVETLVKIAEILDTPITNFFDESSRPIVNDYSNRTGGDNIIYKNIYNEKTEDLYNQLLKAKDDIINAKQSEIEVLKKTLSNFN
jgi:transcriptional regulator with XRE-family HTH domain